MREEYSKSIKYVLPIAWLVLILVLSTQSGKSSSELSHLLAENVKTISGSMLSVDALNSYLRKAAHMLVFGVEGALVYNALRNAPKSILLCSAIALLDEGHKIFIAGRHCDVNEIILDIVSSAVVIAICRGGEK